MERRNVPDLYGIERREKVSCAQKKPASARRLREVIDSVVNKSNQKIAIKSKFRELTCASSLPANGKSKVDKNAPVPVLSREKDFYKRATTLPEMFTKINITSCCHNISLFKSSQRARKAKPRWLFKCDFGCEKRGKENRHWRLCFFFRGSDWGLQNDV